MNGVGENCGAQSLYKSETFVQNWKFLRSAPVSTTGCLTVQKPPTYYLAMTDLNLLPRGLKLHNFGGLEIVSGRYREHPLPRHSHDALMLSLLRDGVQKVQYNGAAHYAGPGAIVAIPPHGVHGAEPTESDGWMFHSVNVPIEMLERIHPEGASFCCEPVLEDAQLSRLLEHLLRCLPMGDTLQRDLALSEMLNYFFGTHAKVADVPEYRLTEKRAVEVSKEYLYDNLDRNVTLDELSKAARMDKFLLVRCFTEILGISPHAWHVQCRFQKSVELLSRGKRIADVAAATGFTDQSHLTRVFKKMTGITPGTYRRDHLKIRDSEDATLLADFWPRILH